MFLSVLVVERVSVFDCRRKVVPFGNIADRIRSLYTAGSEILGEIADGFVCRADDHAVEEHDARYACDLICRVVAFDIKHRSFHRDIVSVAIGGLSVCLFYNFSCRIVARSVVLRYIDKLYILDVHLHTCAVFGVDAERKHVVDVFVATERIVRNFVVAARIVEN